MVAGIGYSSHHVGIGDVSPAVTLGARVVEKHFTLDRAARGSDHAASTEPGGMARVVRAARETLLMMGSSTKRVHPEELPAMAKLRSE